MTESESKRALQAAVDAAKAAGALMYRHLHHPKIVNETHAHDIKLELDVRCQKLIEKRLRQALPGAALLGEEGVAGDASALSRWVVDPIDGTVNFAYGIPHACVSIALQEQVLDGTDREELYPGGYRTILGVVYDPFTDELYTARRGGPAHLNGRRLSVSSRDKLAEAVLALGFSKSKSVLEETLPHFANLVHRVRKIRIMGSAALSLVYVAAGRMDAYLENGVRLWDIAAGALIIECAGGKFHWKKVSGDHRYWMLAENGRMGKTVLRLIHD